jgi:putative heme-binding domain-containing protein
MAVEFVPGNSLHGEELFRSRGCVSCHIVAGKGNANGPELTSIGARRNAEFLRESITKPAAFLPDGFLVVEATTAAGSVIRGVKLNEDNFSIQIATADGKRHSLDKLSLKGLQRRTGQSTMPAFANLPANDIEDLVAYLASLKGAE